MDTLIPIAERISNILTKRGETIGVSESSAGGLISATLLAVPGASRFYRGGGVIYTAAAFKGLMGLSREDVAGMRSSTEPYAAMMAGTIRARLRADWGVCETGAAGPDGNPYGDPAGHTCVALVGQGPEPFSATIRTGDNDRATNMIRFAEAALKHVVAGLERADA